MSTAIFDAIVQLREKDALALAGEALQSGQDPIEVVGLCRDAMAEVGVRFQKNEYFLPELVFGAEIFKGIMAILEPQLLARGKHERKIGKVVIGTVQGDVHDIGKNIAVGMLRANGFDVYDLGVDVPTEAFVAKIKETAPEIVGMSCLISVAWASMKDTVQAIADADLRKTVKVIVGGGLVSEQVARHVGADAHTTDVIRGVDVCRRWVGA